jgi:invasion protein IalB
MQCTRVELQIGVGSQMKNKLFPVVGSCLLTVFFAALAGAPAGGAADSASSTPASSPSQTPGAASTVTCDFSNPGYSGWCRVTQQLPQGARPRRFCSQVLACLNDSRCSRTYCNATTIRGGWKLESVETVPGAH